MNRVWLGTLGTFALMVSAPACIAVLDWDFQEAPASAGGNGGEGGSSTSSVSTGGSGGVGGGAGGAMNPCPGCTYGARYGDDQEQLLLDLALASDGSLYFTGDYNGELRLDASHAVQDTNGAAKQPFLAKLDRTGKPQWITNPLDFPTAGGEGSALSIANGIVAWTGGVESGGAGTDTFVEVRNLGADANTTIWRRTYGSQLNDDLVSAALSPDGTRLYLAGAVVGQFGANAFVNCSSVPAFDTNGAQNILVLAIDAATGNCLWGKTWGGGDHVAGSISVATGSDGSPFISGYLASGTIANNQGFTFPAVPSVQAPKYGLVGFVLKLDKGTGNLLAAKGYAHAGFVSMTSDPSTGTIMAAGALMTEVTFQGATLPGATAMDDGGDNVILAFDENLNEKWSLITGGPNNQFCPHIRSDGAGRAYAACLTQNKIDEGTIVNCSTDRLCSVLLPMQTATGALIPNQIKTFGETQPFLNMGKTFAAAATPSAIAVGGTWTVSVRFWDDIPYDPMGLTSDFDIGVGKVEPIP